MVIALIVSNLAVMGDFVIYPIIDGLYEIFGGQEWWVSTMISIPQLMIVIFSILGAAMLRKMSKKNLLILGSVVYCIGSIGGAIGENIQLMTVMRLLFGIGNALVNVAAVAMIVEVYTDEEKRGVIMGLYNAFQAAVGAILSVCAGYLATIGWKSVYTLYWTGIPMLILIILFTPQMRKSEEEVKAAVSGSKEKIGKRFWLITLAFIIYSLSYAAVAYFVSSYVLENSLGNEATAGNLGSVGTVGSFCCCLLFGKMYNKLGKDVILPWYALNALFMVVLWLFPNLVLTYIAFFIQGGSMGIACSYTYAHIPEVVPPSRNDDAIGIMTAVICIGYFLATYFVTASEMILGTEQFTPVLMLCAIVAAIAFLIELFNRDKKPLKAG